MLITMCVHLSVNVADQRSRHSVNYTIPQKLQTWLEADNRNENCSKTRNHKIHYPWPRLIVHVVCTSVSCEYPDGNAPKNIKVFFISILGGHQMFVAV